MSTSFVSLLNNTGMFTLNSVDCKKVRIHKRDKNCMLVDYGDVRTVKDDTPISDGVLFANQTVIVRPNVTMIPKRYYALVSYNPELTLAGLTVSPLSPIVRPGTEDGIALVVRASRKVDLTEFSHTFELYQID